VGADARRIGKETTVALVPYFESGSPPVDGGHDALLPVRVTKEPEPNGYLVVYLPSGTALHVRSQDLLRVNEAAQPSATPEGARRASPST
jgi:hypothetical protein